MKNFFSKISSTHLLWLLFYIFIFFLLLNNSFNYFDPDFGWHIKVGQEISITGEVPSQNTYNYTYTGSWVDHEWLGNLWLYQAYESFGYITISIFFSLLVVAILAALSFLTLRRWPGISPSILVIAQIAGLLAASPSLGVRLQEFGILFILITLIIIDNFEKYRRYWVLILLPVVFYIWALLHASFLLGLFLVFSWLVVKIIESFLLKTRAASWLKAKNILSKKETFLFSVSAILALVATALTPYKLKLYSFLSGYSDNFYQTHIKEWLPQHSFPLQYKQLIYLALVATVTLLYFKYVARKHKIDLWQMFLLLLFFILSWKARRHFPLMFIVSFPYFVFMASAFVNEDRIIKTWRLQTWLKIYLIICLVLSSLSLALKTNFTADPFSAYCESYPCGAVNYLASHPEHDSQNLFNSYGWGGVLIWALPTRQLFIDGRLPQAEFAGGTFLEKYYDFFSEDTDREILLAEHNIDLVLIHAQDKPRQLRNWEKKFFQINDSDLAPQNNLRDYLNEAGWEKVYIDDTSVLYERP